VLARKFSPTALQPLLRILPLRKPPTPERVDRMAEQWGSPQAVLLPPGGVPGAGRAAGSYLEAWRGQVEEDKRGRGARAGGEGVGVGGVGGGGFGEREPPLCCLLRRRSSSREPWAWSLAVHRGWPSWSSFGTPSPGPPLGPVL